MADLKKLLGKDYEDFLRNIQSQVDVDSANENARVRTKMQGSVGGMSEPTGLDNLLSAVGSSPKYMNTQHYKNNYTERGVFNDKIAKNILEGLYPGMDKNNPNELIKASKDFTGIAPDKVSYGVSKPEHRGEVDYSEFRNIKLNQDIVSNPVEMFKTIMHESQHVRDNDKFNILDKITNNITSPTEEFYLDPAKNLSEELENRQKKHFHKVPEVIEGKEIYGETPFYYNKIRKALGIPDGN